MKLLGIDIGGSGIKAGIVDTVQGKLLTERHRIPTPKPSKPDAVAAVVEQMLEYFEWEEPVGLCFPAVIKKGKSLTYGNISPDWENFQVDKLFEERTGQKFFILNDADAAGLAEMEFGIGKGQEGLVMMITIGTGLGSGVFLDGRLIPNFELGRMLGKDDQPIEYYAADSARKKESLSYEEWGKRFDFFLNHLVRVFSPDCFILGGGASKKMDLFQHVLTVDVPILVAEKKNRAGIIGAAFFAEECLKTGSSKIS